MQGRAKRGHKMIPKNPLLESQWDQRTAQDIVRIRTWAETLLPTADAERDKSPCPHGMKWDCVRLGTILLAMHTAQ